MKKFIGLILAGLLVLAFGTTVFAQAPKLDFRASGFLQATTEWAKNVPPITGTTVFGANPSFNVPDKNAWDKKYAYSDYRMHLQFDAVMGKELTGTVRFEIDSGRWGDTPAGYANKIRDAGTMGQLRADSSSVEVKWVYLDVALPYFGIPVPMTLRIGQQGLAIRNKVFETEDAIGILGGIKLDPVLISPFWFKAVEGVDWNADDVDIWGMTANVKMGTFTLGGYGMYWNANSYPLFVTQTVVAPLSQIVTGTQTADFWWLGFYTDGKAGPLDINLDLAYMGGKVKSRFSDVRDVKYRGYLGKLMADFPFELFNFGGGVAYGSGADKKKTDATGLAGGTTSTGEENSKVGSWMIPPGSENAPSSYESLMLSYQASSSGGIGWANETNTNFVSRGLLGGIWFAKLYGSYKVTPWYKVVLQGLYIGDTTKNGNTFGTAVKHNGTLRDDKTVGWELDLINNISVYKNLVWDVCFGVMKAGDALEFKNSGDNTNDKPGTPWVVSTRFTYSF
jgi:hypothetical protein